MFGTEDKNVTENRNLYVGGSDVPIILGLSKYKSQFELAKEKVGLIPVIFEGNEYTTYGQVMEPVIRDYINTLNEVKFVPDKTVDEERKIRGNCDGAEYEEQLLLEIKTHGKTPSIKVYEAQIQTYLHVFELPAAWLALYERPENFDTTFDSDRLKIEVVHYDPEQAENIMKQIDIFWKRCEALKANPGMDEVEFYSIGTDNSYQIATVANQIAEFEQKMESFKALETEYKAAKERLYELMFEHQVKSFEAGSYQITLVLPTSSTKEEIDVKALKANHPRIAKKFITQKTSNRKGYVKLAKKKAKAKLKEAK